MPGRQLVHAGVMALPGAPFITSFLLNATAPKVFVLNISSSHTGRNHQDDGCRFYAVAMVQRPGFVLKSPIPSRSLGKLTWLKGVPDLINRRENEQCTTGYLSGVFATPQSVEDRLLSSTSRPILCASNCSYSLQRAEGRLGEARLMDQSQVC